MLRRREKIVKQKTDKRQENQEYLDGTQMQAMYRPRIRDVPRNGKFWIREARDLRFGEAKTENG
ncbi:hypothetical protein COLO4_16846 [Corchorus olitorius]|uniref:Uncharacterized protein n=1 Tax=Corchorus olitorius TaxID=93759 RepID=A0A1R3JFH9_9ROSI|nr:hypothetical protein COLO4_16846 [Corchorus olitorius]